MKNPQHIHIIQEPNGEYRAHCLTDGYVTGIIESNGAPLHAFLAMLAATMSPMIAAKKDGVTPHGRAHKRHAAIAAIATVTSTVCMIATAAEPWSAGNDQTYIHTTRPHAAVDELGHIRAIVESATESMMNHLQGTPKTKQP